MLVAIGAALAVLPVAQAAALPPGCTSVGWTLTVPGSSTYQHQANGASFFANNIKVNSAVGVSNTNTPIVDFKLRAGNPPAVQGCLSAYTRYNNTLASFDIAIFDYFNSARYCIYRSGVAGPDTNLMESPTSTTAYALSCSV